MTSVEINSLVCHEVASPPGELWSVFERVDQYPRWWPWLRRFDADELAAGEEWSCEVRPPLGYPVRFDLELIEVCSPSLVTARVGGDIEGTARLDVEHSATGSVIRLESALRPANALMRAISTFAEPVARRSHDWVLGTGLRQFVERAL
jgi:uncharacterized protein YndB with AHSA1/START domain